LVLVTRYGLKGAGFALLISALAQLTFAYLSFPLVLKARPPRLWLSRAEILGWTRRRSSDERSQ
jgi:O-antigen/teichoic acid export membrane protein